MFVCKYESVMNVIVKERMSLGRKESCVNGTIAREIEYICVTKKQLLQTICNIHLLVVLYQQKA